MIQKRVRSGQKFESSLEINGWKKKPASPRLNWIGLGDTNIQKIKNSNFNPNGMILDETGSRYIKYDILNESEGRFREAKSYKREDLKSWKLYSEPYFKIGMVSDLKKISKEEYNQFVENFFSYNLETGLFERVVEKITQTSEGVVISDGFINKDEFEYRTVLLKGYWRGYHRIMIQFRLKEKN